MIHHLLRSLPSLSSASDEDLESVVDALIQEAQWADHKDQAERAEALAILGHELRRRNEKGPGDKPGPVR